MLQLDQNLAQKFLIKSGIENPQIKKIAGDASFRSYYRIFSKEEDKILMYAPPSHEDLEPFVKIDEYLVKNGFSAPKIHAIDEKNGFLLLEDLGDETYGRVLAQSQDEELPLYKLACDVLVDLHKKEIPNGVPNYNNALLFREVSLFTDWYIPLQKKNVTKEELSLFKKLWFELFDLLEKENQVLVLRDYHADNLMTLPDRDSFKKVGLLDFQDAVIGSSAYDLVSLLEDARRDVDVENRLKLFDYFLEKSGYDQSSFKQDYEILSLQRNIKILGIFARLSVRDGKDNYLELLPRVLAFVKARVFSSNPIFKDIGNLLEKFL